MCSNGKDDGTYVHTLEHIVSYKYLSIYRYLKCLFLHNCLCWICFDTLEVHCPNLQQLYIRAQCLDLPDNFIGASRDPTKLEYVILHLESVKGLEISSIIANSPNLVTFFVSSNDEILNSSELQSLITALHANFSERKLFTGGTFKVVQNVCYGYLCKINKELWSVWDRNNTILNDNILRE